MSQLYLVITDGTTTVTIADGSGTATNWRLSYGDWAPAIAGVRESELGGRGPYEDVVEELSLDIYGATAAAAYANLDTLARLLDQAERFSRGENVSPVLIKYSPSGATVSSVANPLQAMILGRASGDATVGVRVKPDFNATELTYAIMGVRVRLVRQGEWKHTDQSASSSATTNGEIASIDLGAALNTYALTKIALTNAYVRTEQPDGLVLITDTANAIAMINAESMTATGWTAFDDSAKHARNTNVLRYTPAGTSESLAAATGLTQTGKRIALFANVRNNSATTVFRLRALVYRGSAREIYTPHIVIPANATTPKWYFMGVVTYPYVLDSIALAATASAASGTLDIDTVAVLDIENPASKAIYLTWNGPVLFAAGEATITLTLDHRRLTHRDPAIYDGATTYTWSWRGDLMAATKAQTLYAAWLKTGGVVSADRWRTATATPTLHTNTWTATRTRAYLPPQ